MRMLMKQAALAAAISAALAAAPSYGQSSAVWSGSIPAPSVRSDDRASAVIRVIDADTRGSSTVTIDTAELARARSTGEIRSTAEIPASEVTASRVRDRLEASERSRAAGEARAVATGPVQVKGPGGAVTALVDDTARSREHARYEADKRRRDAEQARDMQTRAVEIQRSRASGESRADIAWSASSRPIARAAEAPIVRVNPPAVSIDAGASAGMATE